MHHLVRDLYKRALIVGKDHPSGLEHVRQQWKLALRDPQNYRPLPITDGTCTNNCNESFAAEQRRIRNEKDLLKAVAKGRYMVREMMGFIAFHKYRTLRKRYNDGNNEK